MRYLGLGGSAVPSTVTRRLTDLGLVVTRSYGSTEHPSITGSSPDGAHRSKRLLTDGAARTGVEVRLASDGEILSRGPDLCLGYLDPELSATAFDDDGWYHTGDIGVLDDDGYLTITDRKSDVIIRGGENISAIEVEEALLAHAGGRRGGRGRGARRTIRRARRGGAAPAAGPGHAEPGPGPRSTSKRPAWPGRSGRKSCVEVDDYPRTASGKVQKYLVRQQVRAFAPRVRRAEVSWTGGRQGRLRHRRGPRPGPQSRGQVGAGGRRHHRDRHLSGTSRTRRSRARRPRTSPRPRT